MNREDYKPGAANVAHVEKDGEDWTLVLVKELRHSPEKVWDAITDPKQLREWAPFDADASLANEGAKVRFVVVGDPNKSVSESTITRAEAPRLLEYTWGGFETRWLLEEIGDGTKLTLWTKIDRRYIAMGAAGWHICLDVLESLLDGDPIGRMVGPEAIKFGGWQRLHSEYAEQFGMKAPKW